MWSSGCILGELLLGKPIFPGTSTMNQLDRIIELTGKPCSEDIEAVDSPFAGTMLESCSVTKIKGVEEMFPSASPEAVDLLKKLLVFNPNKRLSPEQVLSHPYVAQFHNSGEEPSAGRVFVLPISDNTKYTVSEYRCVGCYWEGAAGGKQGVQAVQQLAAGNACNSLGGRLHMVRSPICGMDPGIGGGPEVPVCRS